MKSKFVIYSLLVLLLGCTKGYDDVFVSVKNKNTVSEYLGKAEKLLPNEPQKAQELAEKALRLAQSAAYEKGIGDANFLIGQCSDYQGDYGKAVEYHFKGLRSRQSIKDIDGVMQSCNNLGIIFRLTGIYDESEKYYLKGLELAQKTKNKAMEAKIKQNLGLLFKTTMNFDNAERYYAESLVLYKEVNNKQFIGYVNSDLAMLYEKRHGMDYGKVLKKYQEALYTCEENGFRIGVAWCQANIGRMYVELGRASEAMPYLEKAEIELQSDNKALLETLINQVEAYAQLGNMKSAKTTLEQINALEPSIKGIDRELLLKAYVSARSVTSVDWKKEYKEKEKKIVGELEFLRLQAHNARLQQTTEVQKSINEYSFMLFQDADTANRMLRWSIGCIVFLLCVIGLFAYKFFAEKENYLDMMAISHIDE